jgi:hypothetical protein
MTDQFSHATYKQMNSQENILMGRLKKHIPAAWELWYRLKNKTQKKCIVTGAFWQVVLSAHL